MGGVASIVAVIFGVIWTIAASAMGAPFFFPLFGVVFIIMGIVQAVYHFKNATSKNRYSAFDITDAHEETDPLNERFGRQSVANSNENRAVDGNGGFCPYCGLPAKNDYAFCRKCGKKI
jgi:hypothetical protein